MFNFKQGALKMVKYFIIFIIPVLVDKFIIQYPEIAQVTIGAILVGITNYIKIKMKSYGR